MLLQVLLQLIAYRTRPGDASKSRICNGSEELFGFTTNQIILLSICIAVLNLFKTIGTLYYEASSLEMGMMQYIRCFLGLRVSTSVSRRIVLPVHSSGCYDCGSNSCLY